MLVEFKNIELVSLGHFFKGWTQNVPTYVYLGLKRLYQLFTSKFEWLKTFKHLLAHVVGVVLNNFFLDFGGYV